MLKRLVLGLWFGSCAAWSVPVVVDQTTTDFQFVFTNATGVPGSGGTGVGAFVVGPDTPPAGSGSVNFQLPDGDHSVGLQTSLFSGTLLSDLRPSAIPPTSRPSMALRPPLCRCG